MDAWERSSGKKNQVALEHNGLKIQILYFEKLR